VTYADTSFLVALYVPDAFSGRTQAWLRTHPVAFPLTGFGRAELRNAITRLVFTGGLSARESVEAWQLVEADGAEGRLRSVAPDWPKCLPARRR